MTTLQAFGGRPCLCFPKPKLYPIIAFLIAVLGYCNVFAQHTNTAYPTIYTDAIIKIATDTIQDSLIIANCDANIRFQSDMTNGGVQYEDGSPRNSLITFCPYDRDTILNFSFHMFELEMGDTLFAYEGVVTHAQLDDPNFTPILIGMGSGVGPSNFNGGWVATNCDKTINPSGCITFLFRTDGDNRKGVGWDARISCRSRAITLSPPDPYFVRLACEEDKEAVAIGAASIESLCPISNDSILIEIRNARGTLCLDTILREDQTFTVDTLAIGTYSIEYTLLLDTTVTAESYLAISPPPLVCNDNINVSINSSCGFSIAPDDLLENPCDTILPNVIYEVILTLGTGNNQLVLTGTGSSAFNTLTGNGATSLNTPFVEVTREDIENAGLNNCRGTITAEIRRSYDYGNGCCNQGLIEDICWGNITYIDESVPLAFSVQRDTIKACDLGLDHMNEQLSRPTILDNCDSTRARVISLEPIVGSECDSLSKQIATWRIEDECGNQTLFMDTVYVLRPTLDDIIKLPNIQLRCGIDDDSAVNDLSVTGIPSFALTNDTIALSLEQNICNYILIKNDQYVPHPGGIKLFRYWSISDKCSDRPLPIPIDTQLIEFVDTLLPTLICPANGRLETADVFPLEPFTCTATVSLEPPAAIDECDPDPTVQMFIVEQLVNGQWDSIAPNLEAVGGLVADTFRVGWVAFDGAENYAQDTCESYFILEDSTPPSAICKDRLVVSFGEGPRRITIEDIDNTSFDACGIAHQEIRRTDEGIWGPYVEMRCDDVYDPVRVEYRITDPTGNQNTCWLFVEVLDDIMPICSELPDTLTYCDELYANDLGESTDTNGDGNMEDGEWLPLTGDLLTLYNNQFGTPDCSDNANCRALAVEQQYQVIYDQCGGGNIRRRYRAIDEQQNAQAAQWQIQRISIEYNAGWQITLPADWEGECGTDLPDPNIAITNGACDLIVWEYEDQVFNVVQDACYKVVRTYYIINWCTYVADSEPIEITRFENALGYVNDDQVIDFSSHGSVGHFKYTQVLLVNDSNAPVVTINPVPTCIYGVGDVAPFNEADVTPGDSPYECDTIRVFSAEASDCEDAFFSNFGFEWWIYENGIEAGHGETAKFFWNVQPKVEYTVKFRVYDNCGNVGEEERTFEFWDCRDPIAACVDTVTTRIRETNTAFINPNLIASKSYDNCTPQAALDYRIWHTSYSSEAPNELAGILGLPNALELGCDYTGPQSVQIFILDDEDNYSSCIANIEINDILNICGDTTSVERAMVAGKITMEDGEEVQDVTVQITSSTNIPTPYTTESNGNYHFHLTKGYNYTIAPKKNINPLNGVSTFDLVLMSKHILGVETIDSPYRLIAADVNRSGGVTAFDIVQLRQLILNITDKFPNNESWRFVDADYVFTSNNPLSESFTEAIDIQLTNDDAMENNFIAVKIGDVNGNALPNNFTATTTREANNIFTIYTEDLYIESGQTVDIPFYAENKAAIEGYQLALAFPNLELLSIGNGLTEEQHIGWTSKDAKVLPISWNQTTQQPVNQEIPLLELTFKAQESAWLSELLSIEKGRLNPEAYGTNEAFFNINLQFTKSIQQLELLQNRPNPFKESTTIGFDLPTDDDVTLSILSMDGKVLQEWHQSLKAGYNEWMISSRDIPHRGVLYYQLTTSHQVATKKMIVLE